LLCDKKKRFRGVAVASMYEMTQQYLAADEFIRLCGEAKTQSDLDKAARHIGTLAGEMARDGVLTVVAGAGAKVAPGVAKQADDVFTAGVKWIRDTLHTPMSVDPVLVPQGGSSLPGVPESNSIDEMLKSSQNSD